MYFVIYHVNIENLADLQHTRWEHAYNMKNNCRDNINAPFLLTYG